MSTVADSDSSAETPPVSSAAPGLFRGLRVVGLFTLLSRVLGLVRDMGMAILFGNGPIMDAFTVAFRVPNMARRLFGEGATTAAFLPEYLRVRRDKGPEAGWELATTVLVVLAGFLGGMTLLVEVGMWWLTSTGELTEHGSLLVELTAILFPYVILICVVAQLSAILHAHNHFGWPAFLPVFLNLIWITVIAGVAWGTHSQYQQVVIISWSLLLAGVLQLLAPLPTLRRLGYRMQWNWKESRSHLAGMLKVMVPVLLGLSVAQVNSLMDSLMAWFFSQPETHQMQVAGFQLPLLSEGTAAALYLGQRLYQFPLGVFGVALGTVMFPRLAHHAQAGDTPRLREDLALGLRLVMFIGLPASVGLVILAEPITRLLFHYGAFTEQDALQTEAMIGGYGIAVWAWCALLIIHRAFYAVGDQQTPLRIALASVAVNLALNLLLLWKWGGPGLAYASSLTVIIQVLAILLLLERRIGRLNWKPIAGSIGKTTVATLLMISGIELSLKMCPTGLDVRDRLLRVGVPVGIGILIYLATAWLFKQEELHLFISRRQRHHL